MAKLFFGYRAALGILSPTGYQCLHVVGNVGVEKHLFSGARVLETERFGMQCLSGAYLEAVVYELSVFGESGAAQYLVAAITAVVEESVPYVFHVYPYLVRPAGFEYTFYDRYIAEPL